MNLQLESCPNGHGAFLDSSRMDQVVDENVVALIRRLDGPLIEGGSCPACGAVQTQVNVGQLPTGLCRGCGGLWFAEQDLRRFQQEWRSRAYGAGSFLSRPDVLQEANKLYTAEVIAGVLTEFELSLDKQ